jgi:hypothetical protein
MTKPFPTEVALCAAFIAAIDKRAWTPYAETAGWDILLVRKVDGFQIGVQAKLVFNLDVINQTIEDDYSHYRKEGPDCRAILVPETKQRLATICAYIGVTVVAVYGPRPKNVFGMDFDPALPRVDGGRDRGDDWFEWCPTSRHKLPEYVPDVAAGSSAPIQLTEWKVSAIKIAIILEQRGYLTRQDFRDVGIDHRRWLTPTGWLKVDEGRYVRGGMPDFKGQHPKVYEKIKADAAKWMKPEQRSLV